MKEVKVGWRQWNATLWIKGLIRRVITRRQFLKDGVHCRSVIVELWDKCDICEEEKPDHGRIRRGIQQRLSLPRMH